MKGNYRRALIIIMVFLVSMLSPLTVDNEPVEAHFEELHAPPVRIQVFLNYLYSNEDLDDGWWFGGDAELVYIGEVEHIGHGKSVSLTQLDWNMDDDGGFWGWGEDNRESLGREPCWWMIENSDGDWDCDGIPDEQDPDDDNDEIDDVDDDLPLDRDNDGTPDNWEKMWVYDMEHLEVWTHDECTPHTDVTYSFMTGANIKWSWGWLTHGMVGVSALVAAGFFTFGSTWVVTAVSATAAATGAAAGIYEIQQLFQDENYIKKLHDPVVDYPLSPGVNYIFPNDGFTAGQGGPIAAEVELVITELPTTDDYNHYTNCTVASVDSDNSEQVDDSNQEEEEVDYQAARESVSDGFDHLRSAFAMINESTSLANSTNLIGSDGCDQVNGTGDCDDWNNSQKPPVDPLNNTDPYNSTTHTVDRGIILKKLNDMVGNITSEYLTAATAVNPDETYELNMDLWYANFLTQGGHYFDALGYYESAILGSIDAIENAPPPPPATVTIQAEGDDIPEDLFIEIYSGDCGDDCAEEDLVFVGDEGDSEIETSLESGEYTVVMISDGDVYSSEYMEVQSGGDLTILKVSDGGGIDSNVLNLAFYLQGLIVAALPALIGFAGSRQYLEGKTNTQGSKKLEPSTTPLWIGVILFLAIFFMMVG